MHKVKVFFWNNKIIVFLSIAYFLFRVINLTKLPIFNDEAIYLDWGWRETHVPGFLYYSLYDSKQPLLMWIYGAAESVFSDPLFAGRIISVIAGFITFLGIYKVGGLVGNKKIALFSSALYIFIPIFSFFDRQALMESSIAAAGIWSFYFFNKLIQDKRRRNSIVLGLILGIGFFIKSTTIIFILTFLIVGLTISYKEVKTRKIVLLRLFEVILLIIIVNSLLIIQPLFWATLGTNQRFSLTLREVFNFPVTFWLSNLFRIAEIVFYCITPIVFIFLIVGLTKYRKENVLLISCFLLPLLFLTLFLRSTSSHYIVPFLPLATVLLVTGFNSIFKENKKYIVFAIILLFSLPALISSVQVLSPSAYYFIFNSSPLVESGYFLGNTSGYGVNEAVSFIKEKIDGGSGYVGVATNTGNPESAIIVNFLKSPNIKAAYFDSVLFNNIDSVDCFYSKYPLYFVSRDDQTVGLGRFLDNIKYIKNPYSSFKIGIFKLKTGCTGKNVINLDLNK